VSSIDSALTASTLGPASVAVALTDLAFLALFFLALAFLAFLVSTPMSFLFILLIVKK
jgi:hypothetical protein